ncbi:MAG: phosphoenolpyruvate--protein phosphotransferase [Pirellulaceae bacterium]
MQTLQGIAVSPGVVIGEALIVHNEGFRIPRHVVVRDAVDDETERLHKAIDAVGAEIERNRDAINRQLGDEFGAIFSAHLSMLRDQGLHREIEDLIRKQHFNAEYAVSRAMRRFAKAFEKLDNRYFAERAHDVFDIERSLLRQLLGERREELTHLKSAVVILAHDLTPSETAMLDRKFVLGFVTEIGGAGGHTAIVAKALEIPAIVGMGPFLTDISGGDQVVIDGDHGRVILQPDEETIARCRHDVEEHRSLAARLQSLRDLPAETTDGVRVGLNANIEFPEEVRSCVKRGSEGIGLYRTEFLYLGSDTEPTEEDHVRAYEDVVRAMGDRPVVIRTLDLGADKMGQLPSLDKERNPDLGLRAIRLSLRNLPLFRVQLRAILRASALGNVQVMFPLISTLQELLQAKMVLADAMEDLEEAGEDFDRDIPVGMMVEVPSAVMILDRLVKEIDFLSIGTNDLVQYVLAADRSNNLVAERYQASDPAVLQMIAMTMKAAQTANVPATVCGQMSAEVNYTMLLLGLGLRGLSVPPSATPEVKKVCRSVSIPQCEEVAQCALRMDSAREIDAYLREELRKVVPELLN